MSQVKVTEFLEKKRVRSSSSDIEGDSNTVKPPLKRPSKANNPESLIEEDAENTNNDTPNKPYGTKTKEGNFTADDVMILLNDIKKSQDAMSQSISQKFANFERNLKGWMATELNNFKTSVNLDVERMNNKIESLEKKVSQLEQMTTSQSNESFHPDTTIVAINLDETESENLDDVVCKMFEQGLGLRDIKPAKVLRLKGRENKPGVVKIQCYNKEDKIAALRAKKFLRDTTKYKRVYLRTSMTHSERLLRLNFETLMKEIPGGRNLRMTGSGKIIRSEWQQEQENMGNEDQYHRDPEIRDTRSEQHYTRGGRGRGRGRGRIYSRSNAEPSYGNTE
jgi:polyhydroxyalkanoate synthesis regulator phasin